MCFTDIEKQEHGLPLRNTGQLVLKPGQLLPQTPGVTSKMEALEGGTQHGTGSGGRVEPRDRTRTDRAITETAKALDQVGAIEAEAGGFTGFFRATVLHAEQLGELGVQPGSGTASDTGREAHPERSVAAIGEMAWRLGPVQGPHRIQSRSGHGTCRVVSTGVEADEQDAVRGQRGGIEGGQDGGAQVAGATPRMSSSRSSR